MAFILLGYVSSIDGKESACNVGGPGLIPESGRYPREGNGKLLQYFYLENSMAKGTCWAIAHGVAELDTSETDWLCLTKCFLYTNIIEFLSRMDVEFCQMIFLYLLRWSCDFYPSFVNLVYHVNWFVDTESSCICAMLSHLVMSDSLCGEGDGTPLQYSCLENPMDRRAW